MFNTTSYFIKLNKEINPETKLAENKILISLYAEAFSEADAERVISLEDEPELFNFIVESVSPFSDVEEGGSLTLEESGDDFISIYGVDVEDLVNSLQESLSADYSDVDEEILDSATTHPLDFNISED